MADIAGAMCVEQKSVFEFLRESVCVCGLICNGTIALICCSEPSLPTSDTIADIAGAMCWLKKKLCVVLVFVRVFAQVCMCVSVCVCACDCACVIVCGCVSLSIQLRSCRTSII